MKKVSCRVIRVVKQTLGRGLVSRIASEGQLQLGLEFGVCGLSAFVG